MKNGFGRPQILYHFASETHRVRASSLLALSGVFFVFSYISLYKENAPKTIENGFSADLKF